MTRRRVATRPDEDATRREEEHAASEALGLTWEQWREWADEEALDLENEEAGRRPWPKTRA